MSDQPATQAVADFDCPEKDCGETIQFDLLDLTDKGGEIACGKCHRLYQFDRPFLAKLKKLQDLILAVQAAEDILGDCDIAVTTPAGEVKVPYRLLLTRLNTLISVNLSGHTFDFHFRVEPLNDGSFK